MGPDVGLVTAAVTKMPSNLDGTLFSVFELGAKNFLDVKWWLACLKKLHLLAYLCDCSVCFVF